MENIEQRVKKIVAEQLGVNEADIKNESSFVERPRRRLARHRRARDGARGGVRDRDPRRGSREDHDRAAGDRLHQAHLQEYRSPSARAAVGAVDARARHRVHVASHARVVVTGLGIVSPVGIGVDEAWSNILAGQLRHRAGSRASTRRAFPSQIAGEVKDFDVTQVPVARRKRAATTPSSTTASSPTMEAIDDAGLDGSTRRHASASACASARASAACR